MDARCQQASGSPHGLELARWRRPARFIPDEPIDRLDAVLGTSDLPLGIDAGHDAKMQTEGIMTRTTADPVGVVVDRLLAALESRGIEVFAVVDHSGAAQRVGQELRDTKLVIFGNPAVGTALMRTSPLIALDLPLKILVWQGDTGETCVSYNEPSFLADRYEISDPFRLQTLASTEVLTDLIVGSAGD